MKKNILILALCLFILSYSFCHQGSALANWENVGLYGGQINTLAIGSNNSSIIFAGSWSGEGLFKSTNGGINWENRNYFRNAEVFSIAIGGEDQKTIWVAHDVYVAKSVDGGFSWTNCFSTGEEERYCYCVDVHPHDNNTLYLGCGGVKAGDSGGAIFKTTDGGESWRKLRLKADYTIRSIAIRQDKPEEVWAVSGRDYVDEGSIYKSINGGKSWKKISTGLKESWFDEIVIAANDPPNIFVGGSGGVYRGKDGGESWSRLNISGWPEDSWCRALALDPADSHKVYAQCYYKFSKSNDGGEHWETSDLVLDDARFELLSLMVDPQRPGVIYGGDASLGIIKSENDGVDWSIINEGISANHIFRMALNPRNTQVVAASTMMGVYIKRGGNPWEVLDYDQSYALTFDPQDGLTLFAGFNGWLGKFNLVSGEATYLEFPGQTVTALSVTTSNPDVLYVGTEWYSLDRGGLYKSTDGGETWERILVKSAPVNVVKGDLHNPDILYAGSGLFYAPVIKGNLYKSTDKGKNWHITSLGDMVINTVAVNPGHPEIVYVGSGAPDVEGAAGVFKSGDGGATWQWSSKGLPLGFPVVDIELDPNNPQILYAATFNKGVFISKNGGEYWTLLGLSDYWTYDVTSSLSEGVNQVNAPSTPSQFYTGTASGLYQYSGAGTGMIIGMVTDGSTGRGITGAQVFSNTGGVAQTEDGAYLLVTAAGGCTVSASAGGYSSSSRTVTVSSGDTVSVDLALISLLEPGAISGMITDSSSQSPIEEATVLVNPGGYSTKSLSEGGFVLSDVVPGTYTLSAFRDGYSTGSEEGVNVLGGETQQVNFQLSLLGTGSIEGVIADAVSSEKIEGVEVNINPGNFFTTSDSEGSYIISDIRTGDYTLSISREGYLPYRESQIEVAQEETLNLNIELQPQSCPFSALGLSKKELKKVRRLRDEALLKNQVGRKWVSSFYQHAPSVSKCIFSNPAFRSGLLELVNLLMPKIEHILAAKKASVTPGLIKKVEECFKVLEHTHKLNMDIHALIAILRDEKILEQFGIILEKKAQKPN